MLYQISLAHALLAGMCYQFPHDIQLLVSGEKQRAFVQGCFAGAIQPNEVLNDVGNTVSAKNLFPKVSAFMSVGIGWVAGPMVVPFVKRQEKSLLTGQLGGLYRPRRCPSSYEPSNDQTVAMSGWCPDPADIASGHENARYYPVHGFFSSRVTKGKPLRKSTISISSSVLVIE